MKAQHELEILLMLDNSGVAPRLVHPSLVQREGNWGIIMEHMENPCDDFSYQEMAAVLKQLHGAGVIHNDLKPEHFFKVQNQIRIIDFGFATKKGQEKQNDSLYCATNKDKITTPNAQHFGQFRGTPRYASIDSHLGRFTDEISDWESLYYIVLEKHLGVLPWSGKYSAAQDRVLLIGAEKIRWAYQSPIVWQVLSRQDPSVEHLFQGLDCKQGDWPEQTRTISNRGAIFPHSLERDDTVEYDDIRPPMLDVTKNLRNSLSSKKVNQEAGCKGEEYVRKILCELSGEMIPELAAKDCPKVQQGGYAAAFRDSQCQTDIYFTAASPSFVSSLESLKLCPLFDFPRLWHGSGPRKVVGEIGTFLRVEGKGPNGIRKRNQNSAALMREVDHRHPLIVADVVMDSLVVIGGTKQATCEAGPLTRRFRGELTMFPADYVLAALGRYHLVVVTDENLETLAWECHTLHSFISGQLEGQKALQKEEVLLAEVAGLKKQLELKEAPKITCQLTQEDILKYWEEEKGQTKKNYDPTAICPIPSCILGYAANHQRAHS